MAYVTTATAKVHLRIDHNDEDSYIGSLIDVAECAIANEIQQPLSACEVEGALPSSLCHAILLLVGDLYNNRESVAYGSTTEVPLSYRYLVAPYKKYDRGISSDDAPLWEPSDEPEPEPQPSTDGEGDGEGEEPGTSAVDDTEGGEG